MEKVKCHYCGNEIDFDAHKYEGNYFCYGLDSCLLEHLLDEGVVKYVFVEDEFYDLCYGEFEE